MSRSYETFIIFDGTNATMDPAPAYLGNWRIGTATSGGFLGRVGGANNHADRRGRSLITLTIAGNTWQIDESKHDVAEVAHLLEERAGGRTWFFLANGNALHLGLPEHPMYAIETDAASR